MDLFLTPQNRFLYEAVESKPFPRASKSKLRHDHYYHTFHGIFFQESVPEFSPKELLLGIACPAPAVAC